MLHTAKVEEHAKKLECPNCREVTEVKLVKQGKASNLLRDFSLLR